MPTPDQDVREASELSRLLVLVADLAKEAFSQAASALELPVPVARAVVHLEQPAPMRDLADRLGCDRSYVTLLADQLEDRGLVERTPGADRRVKVLRLTDAGARTRADLVRRLAADSLVTRRLDPQQRRTLRPLLEALVSGQPH